MKIGLIVAMDKEFDEIRKILEEPKVKTYGNYQFHNGKIAQNDVVLIKCGIGKVNAAIGATLLIQLYNPNLIISTGVAGGADFSMNIGDIVVASSVSYHDVYCGPDVLYGQVQGMPRFFDCDKSVIEKILNAKIEGATLHVGLIASGDQFIDSPFTMIGITSKTKGVIAVDMESTPIAHVCRVFDIPFNSIRVISDIPMMDNNIKDYENFWGDMAEKSLTLTRFLLEKI